MLQNALFTLGTSSSDLEGQGCPFGLVVNSRFIARGHVDHFHVPFPSGHQLKARDAFRISSGIEHMQFPIYRFPAGDDKLIDKGLASSVQSTGRACPTLSE